MSDTPFRMVAKTLTGLENVLAGELDSLGAKSVTPVGRAVTFEGDRTLLYRANLWCRTATRVLVPLRTFHANNDNELYREVGKLDWQQYLKQNGTLMIDAVVHYSKFRHSQFVAQRVKDAIVDQLRDRTGRRPSVDLTRPDLRLNCHIHRNRVTLALDSSGDPLTRRGYRTDGGAAPLNEALAAGIILLTGWDAKSPLIDPMCGSGTLVIEAALIAANRPPGITRDFFGFERWPDYDPELFKSIRQEAKKQQRDITNVPLVGADTDANAVRDAKANADRAGLGQYIRFQRADLKKLDPPEDGGVVVMNPPYGERLELDEAAAFYRDIGDVLKQKYDGYDAFVFTGNLTAVKSIGLRTSRRIELYNGPIECRLLKYEMYRGSRRKEPTEDNTP